MDAILRLFHQYKDAVYRLALSLTGSAADAEDVTQTVFLKLMEKQPELMPGKERAWLLQVTANECRNLHRRLLSFLLRRVLHRRNRPDAAHQPECGNHPSASGQEEPEGNLGTGGIL